MLKDLHLEKLKIKTLGSLIGKSSTNSKKKKNLVSCGCKKIWEYI